MYLSFAFSSLGWMVLKALKRSKNVMQTVVLGLSSAECASVGVRVGVLRLMKDRELESNLLENWFNSFSLCVSPQLHLLHLSCANSLI